MNKKAVHPVVAVALLLVISVLGVVGFQQWYNNYQSSLQTQAETQGSNSIQTRIQDVIGNQLYFSNGHEDLTIIDIKVNGSSCGGDGNYNSGLQTISLDYCTSSIPSGSVEIVVITNQGVFSSEQYFNKPINTSGSSSNASLIWNRTFDYSGAYDSGNSLSIDSSDNVIVTGSFRLVITNYIGVLKYDSDGNLLWNKTFTTGSGNAEGSGVITDSSDNIYVTGYVTNSNEDIFTMKLDSSGNQIWNATFDGGTDHDRGEGIKLDSSNNVIVTGFQGSGADDKSIIIKYNNSGSQIWNITQNFASGAERGTELYLDSSDNIFVTGFGVSGSTRGLISKFDSSGNLLWNTTYVNGSSSNLYDNVLDSSSNLYSVGYTNYGGNYVGVLMKHNSNGELQWIKNYNTSGSDDNIYGITIDGGDNLYVTGSIGDGTYNNISVIKFDSSGTELWNYTYGNSLGYDDGYEIALDSLNKVYVTGDFDNGNSPVITLKLNQN